MVIAENNVLSENALSSMLISRGVSYQFSPFSLTREQQISGIVQRSDRSNISFDSAKESSHHEASSEIEDVNKTSMTNSGSSRNVEAHASVGLQGISIGGSATGEKHWKKDRNLESLNSSKYEVNRSTNKKQNFIKGEGFSFEENQDIAYGNPRLRFSLTLKSLSFDETYVLQNSSEKPTAITLTGLSRTIKIPYIDSGFTLSDDTSYTISFDYEVKDAVLAEELVALKNMGCLNEVLSAHINANDFNLLSQDGKNVFREMNRIKKLTPYTTISIDFGTAAYLSPWSVKHIVRKNGNRHAVTMKEALIAINEKLAEIDALSDQTFVVSNNNLISIENVYLNTLQKIETDSGDEKWGVVVVELNGQNLTLNINDAILATPIKEFKSIKFIFKDIESLIDLRDWDKINNENPLYKLLKDVLALLPDNKLLSMQERREFYPYAFLAVCLNDLGTLRKFVDEYNISLEDVVWNDVHLLEMACALNKIDIVKFIVKKNKDLLKSAIGDRALFATISCDAKDVLKYFFEDLKTFPEKAFAYAIALGNLEVLKELAEKEGEEFNPNRIIDANTLLELSVLAQTNTISIIDYLVSKGADINFKADKESSSTLLLRACRASKLNIVKHLVEKHGATITNEPFCVVNMGDLEMLRYFIEKQGYSVDKIHPLTGSSLLQVACLCNNLNCVKYLIEQGADVHYCTEIYPSPIEIACFYNHKEIVRCLVEKGKISLNEIPFFEAERGNVDLVRYFVGERSFGLSVTNQYGLTLAEHTIVAGRTNQVEVLKYLKWGANLSQPELKNCAFAAARLGKLDCLKFLIEECDVSVDSVNSDGWALLTCAVIFEETEVVRYLVEKGADVKYKVTEKHYTPMQFAARNDFLEELTIMGQSKSNGYDINNDFWSQNILFHAAAGGAMKIIKRYYDPSPDGYGWKNVNVQSTTGWTMLENAASSGEEEMCKYLILRGAKVIGGKSFWGYTGIFEKCDKQKYPELWNYLWKHREQ